MAKKSNKRKDRKLDVPTDGIAKEFNDNEGLWHICVLSMGVMISVATHCNEFEADDAITDLCRWKRGE